MDPNANLAEQERLITTVTACAGRAGRENVAQYYADRDRLQELREALYQWLARGGFSPEWSQHPKAASAYKQWVRRMARVEYGF